MNFLKYLIFNCLLLISEIYAEPVLSCVKEGSVPSVTGFDARFYLSTTKRRKNHRIKSKGQELKKFLDNTKFNDTRKTFVLIHGFLSNHEDSWVNDLKEQLLTKHANIIQVDWSDAFFDKHASDDGDGVIENVAQAVADDIDYVLGIDYDEDDEDEDDDDEDDDSIIPEELNPLDYKSAALRTKLAADKITNLLIRISKARPNPMLFLRSLHLIGHSLGAHVAGQTGRALKKITSVARITGLDPAYPCFHPDKKPQYMLRSTDAKFVDVIHTNSAPDEKDANLGTFEALGHLDFYPHRGFNQPNCNTDKQGRSLSDLEELLESYLVDTVHFLTTTILNVNVTGVALKYLASKIPGSDETFDLICDHGEAPNYFIQSLSKDIFAVQTPVPINEASIPNLTSRLRRCKTSGNCVKMGLPANLYALRKGTYYADTTL